MPVVTHNRSIENIACPGILYITREKCKCIFIHLEMFPRQASRYIRLKQKHRYNIKNKSYAKRQIGLEKQTSIHA